MIKAIIIGLLVYVVYAIIKQIGKDVTKRDAKIDTITIDTFFEESKTKKGFYLFCDVETTGLPTYTQKNSISLKDSQYWPRIIQFCWFILDCDFNLIKKQCYYVNFGGKVPYEATKINGITTQILIEQGAVTIDILKEFLNDLDSVKIVIAHNTSFDLSIIQSEIYRHKLKNKLYRFPSYCTMLNSTNICKIEKSHGGYKWPKLEELYCYCFGYSLFNVKIEGVHNAETDTLMTIRSFQYLLKDGKIKYTDILSEIKHYEKKGSELYSFLTDNAYIINKIATLHKVEDTKRLSTIKSINKRFVKLRENDAVFLNSDFIAKINTINNVNH